MLSVEIFQFFIYFNKEEIFPLLWIWKIKSFMVLKLVGAAIGLSRPNKVNSLSGSLTEP